MRNARASSESTPSLPPPHVIRLHRAVDPAVLGMRIKQARLRQALTQTQLAAPITGADYVSRIESGLRRPSLPFLVHIAGVLGIALEDLLDTAESTSVPLAAEPDDSGAMAREVARAASAWLRRPADSAAYARLVRAVRGWDERATPAPASDTSA